MARQARRKEKRGQQANQGGPPRRVVPRSLPVSVSVGVERKTLLLPRPLHEILEDCRRERDEQIEREKQERAAQRITARAEAMAHRAAILTQETPETHPVSTALRAIIQKAGGYQAVSGITGVGRTSLWHFMAGRGGLSLAAIDRLAEHFGLRLVGQDAKPATSTDTTHGG